MGIEEELKEGVEHAHSSGEKRIGLTMAVVAVLLAMATLLGHRAHTEEGVIQGERNTQWVNYDSKRTDARGYDRDAKLAALFPKGEEVANEFKEKAKIEREGEPAKNGAPAKDGTDKIREKALELDTEMKLTQRRADFYDGAELFLEISIVLCSIALLAEMKLFWQLSFISTIIGIGVAAWGMLGVH
ncbi:MAG TPA: DUF4337 family protein [Candidatus Angelobacter sp.]|jgi:hypothetical protein|nr:DUF4337 family protein [Candidatus Angelobacter sp.]